MLQSGTGVTKCDDCYKVGSNSDELQKYKKNHYYRECKLGELKDDWSWWRWKFECKYSKVCERHSGNWTKPTCQKSQGHCEVCYEILKF